MSDRTQFDHARERIAKDFLSGEINLRQRTKRMGDVDRAEAKYLEQAARKARAEFEAFTAKIERQRSREQLARDLHRSNSRWGEINAN